jgi:Trk K+ transport system NAD-binding subunit
VKYLGSVIAAYRRFGAGRRNQRLLLGYVAFLAVLILAYSALFHFLMALEGREYSWFSGVYWTLTVMSTLGFGDITFQSDSGRVFSVVVLLSGMISMLVLLPFVFIEFFYVPFLEAQSRARASRALSERTVGHVIITHYDLVTAALITRLRGYGYPYVVLADTPERAMELAEKDVRAVVGAVDDPDTYRNVRVEKSALVVATGGDMVNTNIAFTVRELAPSVRIVTTARDDAATRILALAGSDRILKLAEMLGQSLARRTIAGDARAHVIGEFGDLVIAEAMAAGTPLVGRTLAQTKLRTRLGTTVIGVWDRGSFTPAHADTVIEPGTVLVLAGSMEQLQRYDALFCIYHVARGRVVILGSGRVGRAAADALAQRGVDYRIVDKESDRLNDPARAIHGDATERSVLDRAGISEAPAVLVTTHDDDVNVYLTIYCRRLRPDIQIISRANMEKNVSTLHRAGADFVMSYASMGASAIFNFLERGDILMLAEGLNVFSFDTPPGLAGRSLRDADVHGATGCHVVAVGHGGQMRINPDADELLAADGRLVIIGSPADERRFLDRYARRRGG